MGPPPIVPVEDAMYNGKRVPDLIKAFWLSPDISTPATTGKQVVITTEGGQKVSTPERWVPFTLQVVHDEFREAYPTVRVTLDTMLQYKPEECVIKPIPHEPFFREMINMISRLP